MKKLSILCAFCFVFSALAYTDEDVSNANYLADQGVITKQATASKYRLDDKILRQEVIGMALKVKGITLPENYTCKKYFTDATKNDWVCRAVELATDNGIITRSNKYANPGKSITRAEAFSMIYNASGIVPFRGLAGFQILDKDAVSWQKDLFQRIHDSAISMPGEKYITSNTPAIPVYFYPNRLATRAEVFAFAKSIISSQNVTDVQLTSRPPNSEILTEAHLNVDHNLQGAESTCNYFAVYNILSYYKENISLQDFLGISGYYSSFAEMNYGLGWEKYHGKFYMIGGKVLPELGYISYFSQQIQLADYPVKETPIKESISSGIPLLFILNHENFWYLNAIRQNNNPIITNFEKLDVFSQPSVAHAVVITGYKQVGKDVLLEISDSAYENTKNPYYYVSLTNYLDFLNYVKENRNKRTSYEDPLVDNTLIYKIIKNQNKFKISEPDKSLHTLYKVIDSLYISASYLEGKIYDGKTAKKGASVGCDIIELMPKLASFLQSQITIKDSKIDQAESILKEIPQIIGTCNELQELSISDTPELTKKIANANNILYGVTKLISDSVNEHGNELKVYKEGKKVNIILSPKIGNIYETNIRIGRGFLKTNIDLSNIKLSSGKYELLNNNTIRIGGEAIYPLTITFDAESSENVPLLLSIDILPDLKSQGIYHESGYSEILAQVLEF